MGKGLADRETLKLVSDATVFESINVPKEFWCYHSDSIKRDCCFWHFIFYPHGGPERDGIFHPVYEYETDILKYMKLAELKQEKKSFCVYKATGLGLTEFVLLWIIFKCFTDPFFKYKEAILITGPNVDLAQDLIRRSKTFLSMSDLPYIDRGAYELEVNKGTIKCYPSNNIHSARGKPKVSVFFGDEAAFFKLKDDSIVRTVGERYIGKSDSWVIWVSTAGEDPAGFFYDIMHEEDSIYKKFHYYVEAGLKKDSKTGTAIFSEEFIKNASQAKSFSREYLGEWGKNVGNIFQQEALDSISKTDYSWTDDDRTNERVLGIDPGYGSSEFGIIALQKFKGKKMVILSESYKRASYIETIEKIDEHCKRLKINRIMCDSSAPELIKDLRNIYHYNVTPVAFNDSGERMVNYAANHISDLKLMIHPSMRKLKSQLMTIKLKKGGIPDKTTLNPFDLGDALLLALWFYQIGSGTVAGCG